MTRYLRIRHGCLHTPVRTWTHPTGRRITLVALWHTARPSYYHEIRTDIDRLERAGAVVFRENYTTPPIPAEATPSEAQAFTELHQALHLTAIRAAELGWTTQADTLPPAPSWRSADLDPLTILQRAGVEPMRRRVRRTIAALNWADGDTAAASWYRIRLALAQRLAANRVAQRLHTRSTDPILLDQRDRYALGAVHATSQDAVLVWGARHLPGLERGLRDRGYRLHEEGWHEVGPLPSVRHAILNLVRRHAPKPAPR